MGDFCWEKKVDLRSTRFYGQDEKNEDDEDDI